MSIDFKIFSLNLWNLNNDFKSRMAIVNSWVTRLRPDIVFLQEVSPDPGNGRLQSDLLFAGDHTINRLYASQYQWGDREEGLSIITRYPIIGTDSLILPEADGDGQRRVLIAALEIDGHKVLAANTHLAFHIEQDDERHEQANHLLKRIKERNDFYKTDGIILVGDFNAEPASAAVSAVTQCDLHLNDIFADTELRRNRFTYSLKNPYVDANDSLDRWIDYIFISGNLRASSPSLVLDGEDGAPFASDHVALATEIEFV